MSFCFISVRGLDDKSGNLHLRSAGESSSKKQSATQTVYPAWMAD